MPTTILDFVICPGDFEWVARSRNHYISAQAADVPALVSETARMIAAHIAIAKEKGEKPFARKRSSDAVMPKVSGGKGLFRNEFISRVRVGPKAKGTPENRIKAAMTLCD